MSSDSCASSLAALAVQNTMPSAGIASPTTIGIGGASCPPLTRVRAPERQASTASSRKLAHELLELGQLERGAAEVERAGVGMARVVHNEHGGIGALPADAVVDRDQRGAHGLGVAREQRDDVVRGEPADIEQHRREPLGVA